MQHFMLMTTAAPQPTPPSTWMISPLHKEQHHQSCKPQTLILWPLSSSALPLATLGWLVARLDAAKSNSIRVAQQQQV
jgi:hypothetical protein